MHASFESQFRATRVGMRRRCRRASSLALGATLTMAILAALLALPGGAWASDLDSNPTEPFGTPTIQSDKADYLPGETVIITGDNWLPGEHVHIKVNDDVGQTWIRESDVSADESGSVRDELQLPDSFIARYAVTATGDASGTATTTFTDGNVKITSALGRDFNYTATPYSGSTNCTGSAGSSSTKTADANGTSEGIQDNESLLITASFNANAPNASATFSHWTLPGSPAVQFAAGYSATDRTVCVVGFQSGSRDVVGNYSADATPPAVVSINRAGSSPTNTSGSVSWTVTLSESVTGVDTTDFALGNAGLAGSPAITTVTGSGATYTVTATTGTGSGTLRLNLNDNDSIVDAAGNKLGGTGTGSAGGGGAGNGSIEGQVYSIDRAAPTIAARAVTLPDNNAYTAGTWTNKSVRVTFTCSDTGGSGKSTDTASGNTDFTAETTSSGTTVNSSGTCTDDAGNSAAAASFGPIKIDKTAPTVTNLGPTSSPNASGWYKDDVVNRFKAADGLSGLDSACLAAYPDAGGERVQSKTTSGEGAAVKVSSSGCTDVAGNGAAALDSAAFKVDKTAPTITDLGPTSSPNANGWYKDDVANRFGAADGRSGLDSACLAVYPDAGGARIQSKTTSGEGTAVTVDSDSCADQAGNTATAKTSATFKVDKATPTSSASSPAATNLNPFTVDYTASDQTALSGLEKVALYVRTPEVGTGYVLAATDYSPSGSGSFNYTPDAGEGTYRFYTVAYDAAGNIETSPASYDTSSDIETGTPDTTTIFDLTAPVTTNDGDASWHKNGVTVVLTPTDDAGGSGVDKTFYKVDSAAGFAEGSSVEINAPSDHSGDGTHTIHYYSTDKAGNVETTRTGTVKIDTLAPSIVRHTASDSCNVPGDDGWCRGTQTAGFIATDGGSGLANDGAASRDFTKTSSNDGPSVQIASGTVADVAGNVAASIDAGPFKIDGTQPAVSCQSPAPTFLLNQSAGSVSATVADDTSGAKESPVSASAAAGAVGTFTVDVTGHDNAGNAMTSTCSYKVEYRWDGFLQPINDTAHQTGLTQSRFKLGSTVPAKFVIKVASGQVLLQTGSPTFTRTNRLRSCDTDATTEPTQSDLSPDGDGVYRWDGTQYHYNWSTKGIKETGVYRVYANLADSTHRWVEICLY